MAAALLNGYAIGYQKGTIFTGKSKLFCVPVLNCYSCPGALGSCPIGSLQSLLSGYKHRIPFYVLGTMMLFGILLGGPCADFYAPLGGFRICCARFPSRKSMFPQNRTKYCAASNMWYSYFLYFCCRFCFAMSWDSEPHGSASTYVRQGH